MEFRRQQSHGRRYLDLATVAMFVRANEFSNINVRIKNRPRLRGMGTDSFMSTPARGGAILKRSGGCQTLLYIMLFHPYARKSSPI